jgi:hypothetical protein
MSDGPVSTKCSDLAKHVGAEESVEQGGFRGDMEAIAIINSRRTWLPFVKPEGQFPGIRFSQMLINRHWLRCILLDFALCAVAWLH